jgi:pSer/pThr/pTyr-binding forkhead associated (FHA) protein
MGAPKVRLLLKGELVAEVPFAGEPLRIGRMKENDLVVNNLSVSRFHATLRQEDGHIVLKDLGSENGCWVNGRRVNECRVGPGDRIQIGKHQLEIVTEAEAPAQGAPAARGKSDAWDAATTYLVGVDTQARMLGPDSPSPEIGRLDTDAELAPPPDAPPLPLAGEDGVELFGRVESSTSLGSDLEEFDVSELDVAGAGPDAGAEEDLPTEPPTQLMEAGPAPAEGALDGEEAPERAPEASAVPEAGAERSLHAGLILQRQGRLERVIPWERDRLTLGRAAECDIVLATPEVSRRHSLLVREGERFEVRDLESINGTFVNNQKVTRRTLAVGDVVRIEDFELTFVLDRAPLGDALKAEAAAQEAAVDAGSMTQVVEVLDLAPFVEEDGEPLGAISFEADAEAEFEADAEAEPEAPLAEDVSSEPLEVPVTAELEAEAEVPLPAASDTQLLPDEEPDEEKDLVEAPRDARVLRFEVRVRMEELPTALRQALEGLDPADLRLPVELRLATEDEV